MNYFKKNNFHFHGIMFHHFHDDKTHKSGQGSISKDDFVKIIKFIGRENIINSYEFYEKLKKGILKKNEVCLTFDDGLKCVYDVIYPILDEYKLKSFFFIPTIIFEEKINLLEVYRYFRTNYFDNINDFYKLFFLKCDDSKLNNFLKSNEKKIHQIKKTYSFYSLEDIKFRLVRNEMLSLEDYDSIMLKLFNEKKFDAKSCLKTIFLNTKNIRLIQKDKNIIGLHSHSHPNQLHKLTFVKQKNEYIKNKEKLVEILKISNDQIKTMSHPTGNYSEETLEILKELEIDLGFRDNMFVENKMNKINNTHLEIARSNHAEILKMAK